MSLGLSLAALLFTYGFVVQLLVVAWLGAGALIAASSGMALVHSGSLEPQAFAVCAKLALGLDGALLTGIVVAWLSRRRPPRSASRPGLYQRHPVPLTALGLLAALGAVTAFAGHQSAAGRYITTTVVLANTYFFALLAIAWSLLLVSAMWSHLKGWTLASAYRTGVWTVIFALAGIFGIMLRNAGWYEAPLRELDEEVQLAPMLQANGILEFQQAALCIASHEVLEASDAGAPPPACLPVLSGP